MAKKRKGRTSKAPPTKAKSGDNDAVPEPATDIPKTRQHVQPDAGPADRPSATHLEEPKSRIGPDGLDAGTGDPTRALRRLSASTDARERKRPVD